MFNEDQLKERKQSSGRRTASRMLSSQIKLLPNTSLRNSAFVQTAQAGTGPGPGPVGFQLRKELKAKKLQRKYLKWLWREKNSYHSFWERGGKKKSFLKSKEMAAL